MGCGGAKGALVFLGGEGFGNLPNSAFLLSKKAPLV